MHAIVDYRIPTKALRRLESLCSVHLFNGKGITYPAIEGHPDIFLFQNANQLIIAPNTPTSTIQYLLTYQIPFSFGTFPVGDSLKNSTLYNCHSTSSYFFHKKGYTDPTIQQTVNSKEFINLPQAYTRCSLFSISENIVITSDMGIKKQLNQHNLVECHHFSPENIKLPPYRNGFIGGCLGMFKETLVVMGSLKQLPNHKKLYQLLKQNNLNVFELYNGELIDCGGLFFIE